MTPPEDTKKNKSSFIFTAISTLLIVISTCILGFSIPSIEQSVSNLESKIYDRQTRLDKSFDAWEISGRRMEDAELLLIMINLSKPTEVPEYMLRHAAKQMFTAVTQRYLAARTDGLTEKKQKEIQNLVDNSVFGGEEDDRKLAQFLDQLADDFEHLGNNVLAKEKKDFQNEARDQKTRIKTLRDASVIMQIISLFLLLLKESWGDFVLSFKDIRVSVKKSLQKIKKILLL